MLRRVLPALALLGLALAPLPAAHAVPGAWGSAYPSCATSPTVVTLTVTGSGQTWSVPANWNSNILCGNPFANKVEVYAVGGDGDTGSGLRLGGGGGGYSAQTNISLTPSGSASYQLGASGSDSWFNGASLAASSVGAHFGQSLTGAGGSTTGAIGSVTFAGGSSTCGTAKCGGGGGAGPSGAGGSTATASGGAAGGGASGAGGAGNSAGAGSPGSNFGGGGGAGSTTGGAGAAPEIVITYYPLQ